MRRAACSSRRRLVSPGTPSAGVRSPVSASATSWMTATSTARAGSAPASAAVTAASAATPKECAATDSGSGTPRCTQPVRGMRFRAATCAKNPWSRSAVIGSLAGTRSGYAERGTLDYRTGWQAMDGTGSSVRLFLDRDEIELAGYDERATIGDLIAALERMRLRPGLATVGCAGCGLCCRDRVPVLGADLPRLERALGLSREKLLHDHLELPPPARPERARRPHRRLGAAVPRFASRGDAPLRVEHRGTRSCRARTPTATANWLRDRRCSVYPGRPLICSFLPVQLRRQLVRAVRRHRTARRVAQLRGGGLDRERRRRRAQSVLVGRRPDTGAVEGVRRRCRATAAAHGRHLVGGVTTRTWTVHPKRHTMRVRPR